MTPLRRGFLQSAVQGVSDLAKDANVGLIVTHDSADYATVQYNNHMEFDEDDIPAPCEELADDQVDDDLMRDLAERSHQKPER